MLRPLSNGLVPKTAELIAFIQAQPDDREIAHYHGYTHCAVGQFCRSIGVDPDADSVHTESGQEVDDLMHNMRQEDVAPDMLTFLGYVFLRDADGNMMYDKLGNIATVGNTYGLMRQQMRERGLLPES